MSGKDFNLEAYRIIHDTLNRIRAVLREALEQLHGRGWEAAVEPMDRRTFLMQRRDREMSINWRRTRTDDLLMYGNFSDLYEFVVADKRLLQRFAGVASDPEVLRLRFLEVDAIFSRVAYARPISESEMELLINFDERLRRLGDSQGAGTTDAEVPIESPPAAPPPHRPVSAASAAPPPPPARVEAQPAPKASASPPPREPSPAPASAPAPAEAGGAPLPLAAPASISPSRLRQALQEGDDTVVLAALYGEVTSIADGLWSDSSCPIPRLWEIVRESTWYSEKFTALRLRPLSDFYELTASAREKLLAGTSRKQLQDFLKEHNFAQILLALRDLFRARLPQAPTN